MAAPDVVVIGAGCAGLSAAVRLADAGARVTVIEQAPRLGGRASTFVDRVTGDRVDNGQHALFGCYRETYAFLTTIGTAARAPLDPTLSLVMADRLGRHFELRCPAWPAPLHLLGGVFLWQALPLRDRWSTLRLSEFLRTAQARGADAAASTVPDTLTVTRWLESLGQGPHVREWLWHPLALAALNQSPDVASARVFARVMAELFGPDPSSASLGVPTVPLDELYAEPAAHFIERRGGRVVRGGRVSSADSPVVISAVPWHAFGGLWPSGPPAELRAVAEMAGGLVSEPIVSVNLWFDREVMDRRQVGLVGTAFDWAFAREHRVAMVASGARHLVTRSNHDLITLAERELRECVPAARDARRRHAVVVRERRATFSVAPGAPARPGPRTPLQGFYLAGDWTDTGLPATIEGAVRSGHAAADAVLADASR